MSAGVLSIATSLRICGGDFNLFKSTSSGLPIPRPRRQWGHPDCNCGSAGETGKDAREPNRVGRSTVVLGSASCTEWVLRYDE